MEMVLRSSLDSPVTELRRHLDPPITDLKSMTLMSEDHDLTEIQTEGPRRGTRRGDGGGTASPMSLLDIYLQQVAAVGGAGIREGTSPWW
jgi:hypothetical protein